MDSALLLPITIVVVFLAVFFLECISTDIVGTVVYAVPFIVFFFIIIAVFSEIQYIFQVLLSILAIVNAIMIMGNLIKAILS